MSNKPFMNLKDARSRFHRRIRHFSNTRRRLKNAALAYRLGVVLMAIMIALLVFPFDRLNAPLFTALVLGAACAALLVQAGVYLIRRKRFKTYLAEAFRMEATVGGLDSRIISALDFLEREQQTELTQAVIDRASDDLQNTPFEDGLDRTTCARYRRRFLELLVLMLLLGLSPWFGFDRLAGQGRLAWSAVYGLVFPTEWELQPGPGRHIHLLGEDVEIAIRFKRHGAARVVMVKHDVDSEDETGTIREILDVDESQTASTMLRGNAEKTWRIHFEFGARFTRTEPIEVVFTTRPSIENMQVELIAPAYTRQPPHDLDGIQTRIAGLPGTRIAIGLSFSKQLDRATVSFDGDDTVIPLDVVGRFAAISFVISEAQRARFQIEDIHGFGLREPYVLDIDLLKDEPPRLTVPGFLEAEMPARDAELRSFGFGMRAWDDYGVSRTVLKWRQSTLDNRHAITAQGEIERISDPPLSSITAEFMSVFSDLSVSPGDLISFHVEVADNREPDAQTVSSPAFSFFIYQGGLEDMLSQDGDLMFGLLSASGRSRIERARISESVMTPMDFRTVSQLHSDYEAEVDSAARPPAVRGDFATSVEQYFTILSTARFSEDDEE